MDFSEIVIGPIIFSSGAIFLLLGAIASSWMLTRTVHEKKLSLRFLNDHFPIYLAVAVIMGRAGAVFLLWPTIEQKIMGSSSFLEKTLILLRDSLSFWQGGIDFLWAIIGFFVTFVVLCLFHHENTLSWLDAFALPLLLFLVFLEIGSFFAGWNYGSPVSEDFLFAVSYGIPEIRYSGYIHPVQLYGATAFFLLFLGGGYLWTRKLENEWPSGIFGGVILSSLFFISGILEFFRGEPGTLLFNDIIPLSQLLFFGAGISLFAFMMWKGHFHVFFQFRIFSRFPW